MFGTTTAPAVPPPGFGIWNLSNRKYGLAISGAVKHGAGRRAGKDVAIYTHEFDVGRLIAALRVGAPMIGRSRGCTRAPAPEPLILALRPLHTRETDRSQEERPLSRGPLLERAFW